MTKVDANFNKHKHIKWLKRNPQNDAHKYQAPVEEVIGPIEEVSPVVENTSIVKKEVVEAVVEQVQPANTEAKPVKIARLANEKIEVKWNEEIKCDDVNIIIEWSNDLMTIEHPTKIVADTSILGETSINIHYYGLAFRAKAVVIR